MENIIRKLRASYPAFQFVQGAVCCWSPRAQQITYVSHSAKPAIFSVLHEVGHALLGHTTYASDIELLKKEIAAWDQAIEIAQEFNIVIDADHIQNCLDTYRDWIHKRSLCPICRTKNIQADEHTYRCFNCGHTWRVTNARLCRPYRRSLQAQKNA